MDFLLNPIFLFGPKTIPTSFMEIGATILTLLCVFLASRNKISSYPIGILGVILFFFVFWKANLFASALLQLYFIPVQLYGWWYWTRGDKGKEPLITDWSWKTIGVISAVTAALTIVLAGILKSVMPTQVVANWDVAILSFSVAAQLLLDRRIIKTWALWFIVNAVSIAVYGMQGLYLAALTYVILLANAVFHGYPEWIKIRDRQQAELKSTTVVLKAAAVEN